MPSATDPPGGEGVLLGLDGGATGVRVHRVERGDDGTLAAGPERAERETGGDAGAWVDAAAACVAEVAEAAGTSTPLLGLCLPGLRTPDGRGVAKARRGPVDAELCARLESALAERGVTVANAPLSLEGDGLAGGVGEARARDGALREVAFGYYVGVGSGVAEAMVLEGRAVALDDLGLPRAWELELEDDVSVTVMNERVREQTGRARKPEAALAAGEGAARRLFRGAGRALGELAKLRMERFPLERVVLAQRLALVASDAEVLLLLREGFGMAGAPPELLHVSRLREAPALGAAALAADRAAARA